MRNMIIKTCEQKLKNILDKFKPELAAIRTNRPNIQLVENLRVDYFGQNMPLKQLASISIIPPREIQISVWDKNALQNAVKAIEESGLGLFPVVDGQLIRLNLPPLTAERRQEMIKLIKKMTEEIRIVIRGIRDDTNREIAKMKKEGDLSEDQEFSHKDQVQKLVDKTNKELDDLLVKKAAEINE